MGYMALSPILMYPAHFIVGPPPRFGENKNVWGFFGRSGAKTFGGCAEGAGKKFGGCAEGARKKIAAKAQERRKSNKLLIA